MTPEGNLTTAEKKRILLNNIYGVDIDVNAVEVTKLSLLLKCLEGETEASIQQQLTIWNERVLPTLDENIKDGNSLIDTDIYDSQLDFGDERKIKPFNWKKEFPDVFNRKTAEKGIDLKTIATKAKEHAKKAMEYASELEEKLNEVNEPHENYEKNSGGFDVVIGNPPYLKLTANNCDSEVLNYYRKKFVSYSGGSSKNLFQLFLERVVYLSPKLFSFIVPESLLTTDSNGKIRNLILQNFNLNSIVTFDHFVFEDATIGTTIVVGEKDSINRTEIVRIDSTKQIVTIQEVKLDQSDGHWDLTTNESNKKFFIKIESSSTRMGELVEMSKGMVVKNRANILTQSPSDKSLPFLLGNCMSRYNYHYDKYAEYDKLEIIGGTRDLKKHMTVPRLLIRRTGNCLCATYSENKELVESTIYIVRSDKICLKFLLGLLNSKLLNFYLTKKLITNAQGFPQVLMGQLEQLPIVIVSEEKQCEVIKLVDHLLKLNQEIREAKLQTQINQMQSKIDYCENRINEIVYQLYGLTEEEIKIVEGK